MTTNNTPGRSDNNDPPEDTSLNSVLSALSDEGFSGQFIVASEARVLCTNCRSLVAAAWLRADKVTRLEGASDPDDMLVVIPLVCPVCAQQGVLTMSFGPQIDAQEDMVFNAMHRQPTEGHNGHSTPGMG